MIDTRRELMKRAAAGRKLVARRAREDVNVFCEFVLRDEQTGGPIVQAPMHRSWQRLLDEHDRMLLWAHVEAGKGLAPDELLPSPRGWIRMGDIRVGDEVFDARGDVVRVTWCSPVMYEHKCYRFTFDDGDSVIADEDHQWIVRSYDDVVGERRYGRPSAAHAGDGNPCACGCGLRAKRGKKFVHNHHGRRDGRGWRVRTTAQLVEAGVLVNGGALRKDGRRYTQSRWRIPVAGPVAYPRRELPIYPYVLGAWLGDGDSAGPTLTFHEDDRFIFDRCCEFEGMSKNPPRYQRDGEPTMRGTIGAGLRKKLYELGVAGRKGSKFIPEMYLTASVEQRRELLAGLLDTDGTASGGKIEICQTNERLARGILELVRSLGIKASITESDAKLYGRIVGRRWRVHFTPDAPVFRLPRKLAAQCVRRTGGRADARYIVAIDPVPTQPMRCIAVSSSDESYIATRSYTVTHNTAQVSIGRTLWEMGRDPSLRWLIMGNTSHGAEKTARVLRGYIERSPELHEVFPDLEPGYPWGERAFSIKRATNAKDPTVQTVGVHGDIIGSRLDRLLGDDLLDWENTQTQSQRRGLILWWPTVVGRLTSRARVRVLGNAFHPEDLYHHLAKQPGWGAFRYPVLVNGQPRWPEQWPMDRIMKRAEELGPLESQRQLMCVARDDSTARFPRSAIELALRLGDGTELCSALTAVPPGYKTYTGVDLGVQPRDANDPTCLFDLAVDPIGVRSPLNIETGKWSGPEIVRRIVDHHRRYQSIVIVENNAAQDFIRQFTVAGASVPIIGFTTGRNKAHPEFGIESLATEMAAGKWRIPNHEGKCHPEIQGWIDEMLFYSPEAHTGDRLMASWFAREGAVKGARHIGNVRGLDLLRR